MMLEQAGAVVPCIQRDPSDAQDNIYKQGVLESLAFKAIERHHASRHTDRHRSLAAA